MTLPRSGKEIECHTSAEALVDEEQGSSSATLLSVME